MNRSDVEKTIRGCADCFKERFGNMRFDCWLCKESVKGHCGGIDFIEATINQYLADEEEPAVVKPQEPVVIQEQLSLF